MLNLNIIIKNFAYIYYNLIKITFYLNKNEYDNVNELII